MNNEEKRFDSFNYYQNANSAPNAVKANFLVRQYEYSVILEDLFRHPGKGSVQHYLILGRRGSGKSTLLRRIQVEIDTDKKLLSNYIALNLAEEQANVYRLFDLLEEIVKELESQGYDITWPSSSNASTYSNELLSVIHEALASVEKKLVLLLDNIDRIFENLGEDAAVLRAYLQNFGDIKIIGGSTRMTEHFWAYDQPFYEFFRVLRLQPLDREEVRNLLINWGQKLNTPLLEDFVEKKPGQLETVRILTDGLPRTLQFFVNILLTQEPRTGYDYVQQIMDKVTPLYQERLNNLPPAQRKIVLQLAFCWESVGAGELAKAARMENRVVSAQLNQLIDKGIADKIETGTKNHLYRLSERFFNLWLIFTQGSPKEKRKAKFLTVFLEAFYDEGQLIEQVERHLELLKDKSINSDKAAILSKAYAQVSSIPFWLRDRLILRTRELPGVYTDLKLELPATITEISEEVFKLADKSEWSKAESLIGAIDQDGGIKEYLLARLYEEKMELEKAKTILIESLKKGFKASVVYLASICCKRQEFDLAGQYAEMGFRDGILHSVRFLVLSYYETNKERDKALSILEKAVKENPTDGAILSLLPIVRVWNGVCDGLDEIIGRVVELAGRYLRYVLIELLIHHQVFFVKSLFTGQELDGELAVRFFPLNIVTNVLSGKDLTERKIPPELIETIDELLLLIYQRRDFYYGTREAVEYLSKRSRA